ncbi:MAG: nucleotide exchange factor GrpE [Nitrospiria bacterium]
MEGDILTDKEDKNKNSSEGPNHSELEENASKPSDSSEESSLNEPKDENDPMVALKKFETASKENYDRYLRTLADFENYKKRAQKDRLEHIKFANEGVMKELLPVIDNFERAIDHSKENKDFEKMLEGVSMIHKQLLSVLEKFGVTPIQCINQPFDPNFHQSVGQTNIEENSGIKANQIVEEAQRGYTLSGRVLRPSSVIVAIKPPDEPSQEIKQAPLQDGSETSKENEPA